MNRWLDPGRLRALASFLRVLGFVLFGIILWTLDWPLVVASLTGINAGWMLVYFAIWVLHVVIRVLRLRLVMTRLGHKQPMAAFYRFTVEPMFWGGVTPARLGELARIGQLVTAGVPLPLATAYMLLERFCDVIALILIGLAGLLLSGYLEWPELSAAEFVAIVVVVAAATAAACVGKLRRRVAAMLARGRDWFLDRFRLRSFSSAILAILRGSWGAMFGTSVVILTLNAVMVGLLARMLGIDIDFLYLAFCYMLSTIIAHLPVSVGGIGTREASYLVLLQLQGVPAEKAVLLSLLDGTVLSLGCLIVAMLPVWIGRALVRRA